MNYYANTIGGNVRAESVEALLSAIRQAQGERKLSTVDGAQLNIYTNTFTARTIARIKSDLPRDRYNPNYSYNGFYEGTT